MLLALISLNIMHTSLTAEECCYYADECCYQPECASNRIYIGAFGGENFSNRTSLSQRGTAFFEEAVGGPLAVDAKGHSHKKTSGFGGAQIGYEWAQNSFNCGNSGWNITPAAEVEAIFYRHTKKGDLLNPSIRLYEHDFRNTFPMHVGVYFINGVISLNNPCWKFSPYIGGGIGAANISIRKADSLQVAPLEAGINHFNSKRSDTAWTFAAQAKAGVRYNVFERFHIFGEYRFLYVDSSRYILGSTVYPNHAPTSTWNIDVGNICYNAFAFGIRFDL